MCINILLADDHTILRQGLRGLLSSEADLHVVAEACGGREALELALRHQPDVIIMDIGMPDLNGIDAARQILAELPAIRIIGLSMHADRRFATEMLKAGARGYLMKDCAFEELIIAIRTVMEDHIYLSPRISELVVRDYVQLMQREDASAFGVLSPREREVLQLLAEGHPVKHIATHLCISAKTVETYRQQLMDKLKLYSVAELTKYAIREGLTSVDG